MDTSDNKNPNPAPQTPAQPAAAPEIKPVENPNTSLFFNVMPQGKNLGGPMIEPKTLEPKITTQTTSAPAPAVNSESPKKPSRTKVYIIIGVVIAAAAIGGYFLVNYYAQNSYKTEDILVKNPVVKPDAQNSPAGATGFTTPQAWRDKYFPKCSDAKICGDSADADNDGLTNLQENKTGSDPNNSDSDQDGLADGDEVNIFLSSPLKTHSTDDKIYADADFIKGGYSFADDKKMSAAQIADIAAKMKQFGLHKPTIATLGTALKNLYQFSINDEPAPIPGASASSSASSTLSGIDQSLPAKQERDTRRSNTGKHRESGLLNYEADNHRYPAGNDFAAMFVNVKPYLRVATNPVDPINKDPYIYTYSANATSSNFTLTFYSEVAGQIIKKTAADAQKDAQTEAAAIYDNQRQTDLDTLRTALLLYSQKNIAGNQDYVFPAKDKYKTVLVPEFISSIPKDPVSGQDYDYQPSATFDAFTLKATLQNPPSGNTGYMCNQVDECNYY